jgi:hypothetical protein
MELDKKTMIGIGVAIVVIILAFWWFKRSPGGGKRNDEDKKSSGGNKPIIYGSMGCPYTVKQVEKYPDHEFVDCTSGKCPSFVTAYPTTKWPDGRIEVGFS